MNYKEALYFIGNCLSCTKNVSAKKWVVSQVTSKKIDWETVVKVSSAQLVVPALYLNLKRANVLHLLPKDLITYFKEMTALNKERNIAILNQVNHLVELLNKHQIEHVFLKGTAHLLENLYEDISERMIGDIDLLVAPEQFDKTAKLALEIGYKPLTKYYKNELKLLKHYPRLVHEEWIAAVEIHRVVIQPPYNTTLKSTSILEHKLAFENTFTPSYHHQILHNILNVQVNDKGFLYAKINLRQMYDCYLLSFRPTVLTTLKNDTTYYYRKSLYFKLINSVFTTSLFKINDTFILRFLMLWYQKSIYFPTLNYALNRFIYYNYRLFNYIRLFVSAFYKKEIRDSLYRKLSDAGWYKEHLKSYKNKV
ncbi:MAG: hypothetical protein GQ540_08030 [Lutibacter sp.]|uniref:nucleotidyltransferase family protein n=1 Tax=Lutibacter sp. TaxID=1925666 RepID=UPI0019FB8E8B|nr:nucleotidyltransferase family protein [Lutibacter sp.]NOR28460.1 hypothetical protein [Lutibacter sp.]